MNVHKFLKNVKYEGNIENVDILGLTDIIENVKKGYVFIAIKGLSFDGNSFAEEAIKKGAVFVVTDREMNESIKHIKVDNIRQAYCKLCNNFFDDVLNKIDIIGVCGTCGKTSTTYIFKDFNLLLNQKVGVIGTNGIYIGDKYYESKLTTPDTYELFSLLNEMVQDNIKFCIMEISAHAIYFDKIFGLKFKQVIFTNFSQDHLDFFDTMENYKNAKLKLFKEYKIETVIINIDEEIKNEILQICNDRHIRVLTYSFYENSKLKILNYNCTDKEIKFNFLFRNKEYSIRCNLIGEFNINNVVSILLSLNSIGVEMDKLVVLSEYLKQLKGRMDNITIDKNHLAIIDYAHTIKSYEICLETIKNLFANYKIISVFGAPGNREQEKRMVLGSLMQKYSTFSFITSDNPNYENCLKICQQIKQGFKKNSKKYKIVENRELAINMALKKCLKYEKSVLLLLGKGIEKYQIINGVKIPFSDYDIIENLIEYQKK